MIRDTREWGTLVGIEDNAFTLALANGEWIRFSFAGASHAPAVRGEGRLPGTRNYFVGNDPSGWATNVPTWGRVAVDDLYPGIDLVFRSGGEGIEYDFVVAPGASAERIVMTTEGTMRLRKDGDGLVASTNEGVAFCHLPPRSFQPASRRNVVASAYRVRGNEVGFAVGEYDRSTELIIDPVIVASTYVGGSSDDKAVSVALDAAGSIYVVGHTYSSDYPFLGGAQATNRSWPGERDAFVTKLDPSGKTVIYSTYFGGKTGYDIPTSIAVDASGAAYFGGETYSTDLPVSANAFQKSANIWVGTDGFLVKLSPAGNAIAYCTYLAAESKKPSFERVRGIAVDAAGHAFVTGETEDPSWPVTAGAYRTTGCDSDQDAFVAKVSPDGSSLVYSTYLCGSGWDTANDIQVDGSGNAFVTGTTLSDDFPQVGGQARVKVGFGYAWVAKLNPSGSTLLRSTLLGGSDWDQGISLALSADGTVYIAGTTQSKDFPALNGYQQSYRGSLGYCYGFWCGDSYIARLGSDLAILSATYVGGAVRVAAIAMSPAGVVAVGTTESTDFPLVSPVQSKYGGSQDAFVSVFDPTLRNLTFSTFLGGSDWDIGEAVAVDSAGAIYVAGWTGSPDFPVSNAYQSALAGDFDAFVVKFSAPPPAPSRKRAVRH